MVAATPLFWQLQAGQTSAFGWSNIADNFRGDVDFLFNTGPSLANSWYLSVAGVLGLGWLGYRSVRWLVGRDRPALSAPEVVALFFGAGVAGHFVVLLFYWWAKFDDLMASRFALPMCFAFAVTLRRPRHRGCAGPRFPALRIGLGGPRRLGAHGGPAGLQP